jgi:hypothetical protein
MEAPDMKRNHLLRKRAATIIVSLMLSLWFILYFLSPKNEHLLSPGGSDSCHSSMACIECHEPAEGSTRQQIQANIKHWLGQRKSGADLVTATIDNDDCLACHESANEVHSTHRFMEPRFAEARAELGPHECRSCHSEHTGKRVEVRGNFCFHCHDTLEIVNDPVVPSHAELIQQERYDTCLQCHDYHRNHLHEPPNKLTDALRLERIQAYLDGHAETPYGDKREPYRKTRQPTP